MNCTMTLSHFTSSDSKLECCHIVAGKANACFFSTVNKNRSNFVDAAVLLNDRKPHNIKNQMRFF